MSLTYANIRERCRLYWNFHPETKASILEMWEEINSHSGWRRTVAEPSAAMLLGDLAAYCDESNEFCIQQMLLVEVANEAANVAEARVRALMADNAALRRDGARTK